VYTGILDEIIERLEGQGGYRRPLTSPEGLELAAEQQAAPGAHRPGHETHRLLNT
jgi:hypothetical protein